MNSLDTDIENAVSKNVGFIEHVFYLTDSNKNELINLLQYVLLGIIPVIIINKLVQNFIPEVDEEKDSIQISLECIAQIVVLFTAMFFIHRMITYIPTYTGQPYAEVNLLASGITFLIIVLGLQTKLGEKIELLYNRILDYWYGDANIAEEKPKSKNIISNNHQPSRADNLGMSSIPQNTTPLPPAMPTQQAQQPTMQQQVQPQMNFDMMYQEPMAANEGFTSFGGAW